MAGRLEMPNGRSTGVGKRDRHHAEAAAGFAITGLGAPRMRSVGPGIAAGREYAREAGDVASMARLDRAAGLRRQFLTGTTPFTPKVIQRRPGLAALGGLALLAHSRRTRGQRTTGP